MRNSALWELTLVLNFHSERKPFFQSPHLYGVKIKEWIYRKLSNTLTGKLITAALADLNKFKKTGSVLDQTKSERNKVSRWGQETGLDKSGF